MSDTTNKIAKKIMVAAEDKKATDVRILNVEGISMVTDSFVICSAQSNTQVKAIADNIEDELAKDGVKMLHKEGYREGRWILMDFGSCIAHIFAEEEREYYNLERLWGEGEEPVHEED